MAIALPRSAPCWRLLKSVRALQVGSPFRLRIFLPRINDAKQPLVYPRPATSAPIGAGRTVLVVDDNPAHRDMITEALTPLAFTLFGAANGAEGLDIAASVRPDLFLLDIALPDMDGWRLAETLRTTGHDQAKIIIVSASAMEEYRSAIAYPFHDAAILKPVDIDRLTETVVTLLDLTVRDERAASPSFRSSADLALLDRPRADRVNDLIRLCEIGHISGLRGALADIALEDPAHSAFADYLLGYVDAVDLRGLMRTLEGVSEPT